VTWSQWQLRSTMCRFHMPVTQSHPKLAISKLVNLRTSYPSGAIVGKLERECRMTLSFADLLCNNFLPMWLQEEVMWSFAICCHHGTCRSFGFHDEDSGGECHDGRALVEKRLSVAHQNCLSLAHFGSPATYMPAVMLTAGAFGLCAGDNKQYRWRIWLVRRG
jgi:hypothetical protein